MSFCGLWRRMRSRQQWERFNFYLSYSTSSRAEQQRALQSLWFCVSTCLQLYIHHERLRCHQHHRRLFPFASLKPSRNRKPSQFRTCLHHITTSHLTSERGMLHWQVWWTKCHATLIGFLKVPMVLSRECSLDANDGWEEWKLATKIHVKHQLSIGSRRIWFAGTICRRLFVVPICFFNLTGYCTLFELAFSWHVCSCVLIWMTITTSCGSLWQQYSTADQSS